MTKLKGHSSLNVKNVPKQAVDEKIGLVDVQEFDTKTYRLSLEAIAALEDLTKRLSGEARIKLAMGKVLELCIFNAENKTLDELLKD